MRRLGKAKSKAGANWGVFERGAETESSRLPPRAGHIQPARLTWAATALLAARGPRLIPTLPPNIYLAVGDHDVHAGLASFIVCGGRGFVCMPKAR